MVFIFATCGILMCVRSRVRLLFFTAIHHGRASAAHFIIIIIIVFVITIVETLLFVLQKLNPKPFSFLPLPSFHHFSLQCAHTSAILPFWQ